MGNATQVQPLRSGAAPTPAHLQGLSTVRYEVHCSCCGAVSHVNERTAFEIHGGIDGAPCCGAYTYFSGGACRVMKAETV